MSFLQEFTMIQFEYLAKLKENPIVDIFEKETGSGEMGCIICERLGRMRHSKMFGICPESQGAFEIRATRAGIFVECFEILGKENLDMLLSGLLLAEEKVRGYNQKRVDPVSPEGSEDVFELLNEQ